MKTTTPPAPPPTIYSLVHFLEMSTTKVEVPLLLDINQGLVRCISWSPFWLQLISIFQK